MLEKSLIVVFAVIAIGGAGKIPFLTSPRFTFVNMRFPPAPVIIAPVIPAPIMTAPVPAAPAKVEEYPLPFPLWPGADKCTGNIIYRNDCNICRCGFRPPCTMVNCDTVPVEVKKANALEPLTRLKGPPAPVVPGKLYMVTCGFCVGMTSTSVNCVANCVRDINY